MTKKEFLQGVASLVKEAGDNVVNLETGLFAKDEIIISRTEDLLSWAEDIEVENPRHSSQMLVGQINGVHVESYLLDRQDYMHINFVWDEAHKRNEEK